MLFHKHSFLEGHSKFRFVFKTFITGVIQGFGAVVGGTIGVAVFVFLLRQLEIIPILGDLVTQIVMVVQSNLR